MKKVIFVFICLAIWRLPVAAQELNCHIDVISPQIQGVNPAIFEQLESDIFDFLNNRKWTNDQFTIEERIECSIILQINRGSAGSNNYGAELQIISSRPIYKTDYKSPVLRIRDLNVNFEYTPNTQWNFNPDRFDNNLISVLAYYAYMIIGYDYDTFSLEGGTPYYQEAQRIVQGAQSSNAEGWKAFEGDKNRYWMVEDILHRTFKPLRECLYMYHRKGLDFMSEKTDFGRQNIFNALQNFDKIHRIKPMAYDTQLFFLAKSDEIINIFTPADPSMRTQLYEILSQVDPGHLSDYGKMQKGK